MDSPITDAAARVAGLIDRAPWSVFQKSMLLLLSLAVILDGFNNQIVGFALPAILKDWGRQRAEFAPVVAAGLVGMGFGTFLGGLAADRWGRKPALIGSVTLFGLATALTCLARSPLDVGVLRLVSGLGIGAALPCAAALAAEFTPERKRPMAVIGTIVSVPLGGLVGGLLAAQVLPTLGWRALFLMGGGAPIAIALILLVLLPESPGFLAYRGDRTAELMGFLRRCGCVVDPDTLSAIGRPAQRQKGPGLGALFEGFYRRDTLFIWFALFCTQAAVYLVFSWLPTLLGARGFALSVTSDGLAVHNLGGVVGALLGIRAIEIFGSRRTMTAFALGAAIIGAFLAYAPIAPGVTPPLVLIGLLAAHGFFLNAVQTTSFALTAHVYLADVRATGAGAALAVGRIGGILSAFGGASLLAGGGQGYFVTLTIVMVGSAVGFALVRRHIPSVPPRAR